MTGLHSPGPWVVRVGCHIIANPERDGRIIASVDRHDHLPETCEANARLIAAAPDMLAALKALVEVNERHNKAVGHIMGSPPGWNDSYLDDARAAIAKAKGGTNA